jgi:putative glutamine amidotransferase
MAPMPYVGITMSVQDGPAGERLGLNTAYLEAVQRAGGIPVLLPPALGRAQLDELFANLDGLLLSGGGDVEPGLYGERPHPKVSGVSARRDRFEIDVVRRAIDRRMPLLAICRGMQILNVALGGTLYQHVPQVFGDTVEHQQVAAGSPRDEITHPVEIRPGTLLANLVGSGAIGVNSIHHQAVRTLGVHLVPSARAPDGLIEAIEGPPLGDFVLGVQWHPEELVSSNDAARAVFEAFLDACQGAGSRELAAAAAAR